MEKEPMRGSDGAMGEKAMRFNTAGKTDVWDGTWLLGRVARRDTEALAQLYRMWGDRLYSMALNWIGDEGASKEVLQDCFLKIWRKASDFKPQKSQAFTWCVMILRGLCLDVLRRRRRRAAVWEDSEKMPTMEVPDRSGVEDLFFRETVARVRRALDDLDDRDAEIIRVALFDPGTLEDHAERWQVPVGTAKVRVHRAMVKLRELLKKGGVHGQD